MKTGKLNLLVAVLALAAFVLAACTPVRPVAAPAPDAAANAMPAAPAAAATDLDRLLAHPWQWVSFTNPVEAFDVDAPAKYTLAFGDDGIVEIVADCNTAIAAYGIASEDAVMLTMTVAPRTEDACPPDSRGDQFLKLLGGAAIYFFQDGRLFIDLMADGGTMVFDSVEVDTAASQAEETPDSEQAQRVETLGNLTYSGLFPDRTITLVDGRADYEEEGPGTPFVSLMDRLIPTGDLDGDGAEDAVALLEDHSSGSGNFLFLAAVLNARTEPTPTTALMLGDRIQVKSLAIEGDQVVAELVAQGGSDPACCPTWNVRKTFALQDGALVETGSEELSQVALADLNGTAWRLVDLGADQPPVLPDAEITLAIDDGQISGFAGCNNYTAALSGDPAVLQSFVAGPIAVTKMACADAISAQEATYLALLESVPGWRYEAGHLALAYLMDDGAYTYLLFAPQPVAAQTAATDSALRVEPLAECFAQPPDDLDVTYEIDCGYVVVPASADDANSPELKLGFTRLSSGQGSTRVPLFMLAGGPGGTNISPDKYRLFQSELLGGVLNQRDIVILEQRGTQHTSTFLDCPALATAPWTAYTQGLQGKEADDFAYAALQGCIDDFKAQGVDFDAYNSVENAADVYLARAALGYDKIIYYGASYGAQLGQHIMRDYPFMLEAVVLDGAEALSRKSWVENRALDAQWGIDNLTALCSADAKCAETYDIPALVEDALALFDDGPLPYTYTDPADPTLTVEGELTVDDMVGLIYQLQGDRLSAMSLPATLAQLTGSAEAATEVLGSIKGSSLLASHASSSAAGPSPMAILMHLAMVCSDDPVKSVDDVKLDGVGRYATLFGQAEAEDYAAFCALIDVASLPDDTDVDVTTDVPTLLLGGDLDVATPVFRSQEVADGLPNATLIVFPGRTHVQIAGVNLCAADIMTQFVFDPAAPLDTSCTAESPVMGFVLPDGSMSQETE
jgi:pimeloyl-ACP methyl ester carboxylesterase/heat shock protein HslJ